MSGSMLGEGMHIIPVHAIYRQLMMMIYERMCCRRTIVVFNYLRLVYESLEYEQFSIEIVR